MNKSIFKSSNAWGVLKVRIDQRVIPPLLLISALLEILKRKSVEVALFELSKVAEPEHESAEGINREGGNPNVCGFLTTPFS